MSKLVLVVVVLSMIEWTAYSDCAFIVGDDLKPQPPQPDELAPRVVEQMTCQEWNGQLACCNKNSFIQTTSSFGKIDTVFGGSGGGCDVCAVNLKRFWCQYACSPTQANFVKVVFIVMQVFPYEWVDSFTRPGEKVFVQRVELTVESSTACTLFKSCQRTSYASQVSAMQNPAGFLNFQGTNAIEDGTQTISIKFTDNKDQGLYLPDLDTCDKGMPQIYRGFKVQNCSCNSCQAKCSGKSIYEPTGPMEGFDIVVVASVWGAAIVVGTVITIVRRYRKNEN